VDQAEPSVVSDTGPAVRNVHRAAPPPGYSGTWTVRYANGQKKSEAYYSNGKLHGARTSWHDNGRKMCEESYKNGVQHGTSTRWYRNGQKQFVVGFQDGEKRGRQVSWYRNGWMKSQARFHEGELAEVIPAPGSESAREWGIQKAKEDIASGKRRIFHYGKPWSVGKPLKDDRSGLPVEIVAGCKVTEDFVKRVRAYNETMRASAKESPEPGH
jgi:hypothetical protein